MNFAAFDIKTADALAVGAAIVLAAGALGWRVIGALRRHRGDAPRCRCGCCPASASKRTDLPAALSALKKDAAGGTDGDASAAAIPPRGPRTKTPDRDTAPSSD
ncbi:MAG: hypothetical protein LBR07_02760 [Puniceicoccales bacterium]|nr:hypothetical protein [Puniceicoccales bacterium]